MERILEISAATGPSVELPYGDPDPYWENVVFLLPKYQNPCQESIGSYTNWTGDNPKFEGDVAFEVLSVIVAKTWQLSEALGTEDFTIETWLWPMNGGAGSSYGRIFQLGPNSNSGGLYIVRSANPNPLTILIQTGKTTGGYQTVWNVTSPSLPNDTWPHVALVRNSGQWSFYYDGTRVRGPNTVSAANGNNLGHTTLYLGHNNSGSEIFRGRYSNTRVTKGIARYTGASFQVPTGPFPNY